MRPILKIAVFALFAIGSMLAMADDADARVRRGFRRGGAVAARGVRGGFAGVRGGGFGFGGGGFALGIGGFDSGFVDQQQFIMSQPVLVPASSGFVFESRRGFLGRNRTTFAFIR